MKSNDKKTYYALLEKCGCIIGISIKTKYYLYEHLHGSRGNYTNKIELTREELVSAASGLTGCTCSKSSTHKQYFNKLKDDSKKKKDCGYCQLNKGEECMYSDNK